MEIAGVRTAAELSLAQGAAGGAGGELGKTEFLELMLAQISNQNPLDPVNNEDFVAQLAQFSSLEGIQNLNSSLANVAAAMQASLTMDAAGLVGRSVIVPTSQAYMQTGGVVGSVEVPSAISGLTVTISGASGNLIRSIDAGTQPAGEFRFAWDGTDAAGNELPAGVYRIRAFARGEGDPQELTVNLPERVVSVSLDADGTLANLAGGTSVPIDQIREIQ